MNIYEILKKFREESFSESEKGTKFERLIKNWFLTASIYSGKIKNVYMWNEFPYRDQLGLHDVGIDLVAETYDNEYWAIQCKCYKESSSIQKHHVDTFISTLNRKFYITNVEFSFSNALWVQTNSVDKWSSNALESIKNQSIPVQIIDIETLSNSDVNWKKIGNLQKKAEAINSLLGIQKADGNPYFHIDYLMDTIMKITPDEKSKNDKYWAISNGAATAEGVGEAGEEGGGEEYGGDHESFGGEEENGGGSEPPQTQSAPEETPPENKSGEGGFEF